MRRCRTPPRCGGGMADERQILPFDNDLDVALTTMNGPHCWAQTRYITVGLVTCVLVVANETTLRHATRPAA